MCSVLWLVVSDRNRKGETGRKSYETNEEPGWEGEMGIGGKGEVEQNVPFFFLAVRAEYYLLNRRHAVAVLKNDSDYTTTKSQHCKPIMSFSLTPV